MGIRNMENEICNKGINVGCNHFSFRQLVDHFLKRGEVLSW